MYDKNLLACEGSELSFEELRAKRYFKKYERLKRWREWGILLIYLFRIYSPILGYLAALIFFQAPY